ncbi:hypothetical protein HDA32_004515 [Spinactinospora alkalitolerans]|uniref:Transposase n=1 Tax=Spinactinospora alkalitolerans TaxID=687207 RepID=A0A852U1I7_9ACTN|nr:hypothetical protein [Spinactinospora alkalitolerans]
MDRRRKKTERGGYVYLRSAVDGFSRLACTEACSAVGDRPPAARLRVTVTDVPASYD